MAPAIHSRDDRLAAQPGPTPRRIVAVHSANSDIEIRRATNADVPALVELMQAFYAESNYPLDRDWAASSFRTLVDRADLGGVWLASRGATPAGHAVLTVRYCMEFGGTGGYIDDLFVEPAFRRRGIGHALLGALFAECGARGCKAVHVEVGAGNASALRLYSRFGLTVATDDRILLSGRLPPII
ncbi:GNAT family N-acetyltransferase [Tahibacter caeni]|uniref:GNAT family N-acetyltransferase n=1 Tax=Tahibacter caeni TaxID=1453545 RepID=UPI00214892CB|nr:GNAT family N-acetyltransferase [Tahibacter caeni]